jgi:hypothetical protein
MSLSQTRTAARARATGRLGPILCPSSAVIARLLSPQLFLCRRAGRLVREEVPAVSEVQHPPTGVGECLCRWRRYVRHTATIRRQQTSCAVGVCRIPPPRGIELPFWEANASRSVPAASSPDNARRRPVPTGGHQRRLSRSPLTQSVGHTTRCESAYSSSSSSHVVPAVG